MKASEERILTTHTGSLPRTQELTKLLVAREQCREFDPADMPREARAALVAEIETVLGAEPRAHWLALFARENIPAGPINRLDEVAGDPALIERGLIYGLEREGRASVPQVNTGVPEKWLSASQLSPTPRTVVADASSTT